VSTSTISFWLPEYEFEERHSTAVAASAEAVERALREFSIADVQAVRALYALRALPARLAGRAAAGSGGGSFIGQLVAMGGVILEDRPGLIVAGLAGQFWRLRGGNIERLSTSEDFTAYTREDSCKAVIDFEWDAGRLATTTRVHVPDAAARRRFARYWRVIRPASGLIRVLLLRSVRRAAETYDRADER
jgi:hypothetical protein